MSLSDEKYLSITTFRKDGTPKATPIWPVDVGQGRVGFITSSKTWKVKRIRNDPRVELQPSDARGSPKEGSASSPGTAEVVEGADFRDIEAKVREKYGFQLTLINLVHTVERLLKRGAGDNDCAVIVTLD